PLRPPWRGWSQGLALLAAVALGSPSPAWAQAPASAPDARPETKATAATQGPSVSVEQAPDEAPSVIPPQLTHYEPPVYPEEALEKGLTAEVDLQLTVQDDGTVQDPIVVTPKGHGFDEAALAAALKLQFAPALADGIPRA